MSATNRGAARAEGDFYETPSWTTAAILPQVPAEGLIFDAGAGTGAISRTLLASGIHPSRLMAAELDAGRAAECRKCGVETLEANFLAHSWAGVRTVIMNPPFNEALEFIEHAIRSVEPGGTVIALTRINWLGAQKRARFHVEHPSDVYVLPRRPSFTGGGGTDATEYCWMVWGPGRGNRWWILDLAAQRSS
jgi:hypothetical protein